MVLGCKHFLLNYNFYWFMLKLYIPVKKKKMTVTFCNLKCKISVDYFFNFNCFVYMTMANIFVKIQKIRTIKLDNKTVKLQIVSIFNC